MTTAVARQYSESTMLVLACVGASATAVTFGELLRATGLKKSHLSITLRRLEQRGLVTKPFRGQYILTS